MAHIKHLDLHLNTLGYREKSWSDLYSYYIALRKSSKNSITTL